MDQLCIDLGSLLDNSALRTLDPGSPQKHSLHCLLDINSCVKSGYTVLCNKKSGKFKAAYKFDSAGNNMILAYGRKKGDRSCTTCSGSGKQSKGL